MSKDFNRRFMVDRVLHFPMASSGVPGIHKFSDSKRGKRILIRQSKSFHNPLFFLTFHGQVIIEYFLRVSVLLEIQYQSSVKVPMIVDFGEPWIPAKC